MQSSTYANVSYSPFLKLNPRQKKDCLLINEVKRYKFLYDKSQLNHKRSKHRQGAWDEIGANLKLDGIDCMNRWKMLRDRYRKEKRLMLRDSPSTSTKKKWIYYDMLSFLNPYLEVIKPLQEDLEDTQDDDKPEDSVLSQIDIELLKSEMSHQDLLANSPSQNSSQACHNNSTPAQFIRIIVPPTNQQMPQSPVKHFPRKYVKILPKTENHSQNNTENCLRRSELCSPLEQISAIDFRDQSSNDSLGLSPTKNKLDTVDHLMAFMGNTIRQLPHKKQMKICQDLTSAFFNIISNDEDEES